MSSGADANGVPLQVFLPVTIVGGAVILGLVTAVGLLCWRLHLLQRSLQATIDDELKSVWAPSGNPSIKSCVTYSTADGLHSARSARSGGKLRIPSCTGSELVDLHPRLASSAGRPDRLPSIRTAPLQSQHSLTAPDVTTGTTISTCLHTTAHPEQHILQPIATQLSVPVAGASPMSACAQLEQQYAALWEQPDSPYPHSHAAEANPFSHRPSNLALGSGAPPTPVSVALGAGTGTPSFAAAASAAAAMAPAFSGTMPPLPLAFVATDIEGSTELWEKASTVMEKALEVHDHCLRVLLYEHSGREVSTEGDAFTCAFQSAQDAVLWCLSVQQNLMTVSWPEELLKQTSAQEKAVPDGVPAVHATVFRGLRVRMGVSTGSCYTTSLHPVTGQCIYQGRSVDLADAICNMGFGGQVLVCGTTYREIYSRLALLSKLKHVHHHHDPYGGGSALPSPSPIFDMHYPVCLPSHQPAGSNGSEASYLADRDTVPSPHSSYQPPRPTPHTTPPIPIHPLGRRHGAACTTSDRLPSTPPYLPDPTHPFHPLHHPPTPPTRPPSSPTPAHDTIITIPHDHALPPLTIPRRVTDSSRECLSASASPHAYSAAAHLLPTTDLPGSAPGPAARGRSRRIWRRLSCVITTTLSTRRTRPSREFAEQLAAASIPNDWTEPQEGLDWLQNTQVDTLGGWLPPIQASGDSTTTPSWSPAGSPQVAAPSDLQSTWDSICGDPPHPSPNNPATQGFEPSSAPAATQVLEPSSAPAATQLERSPLLPAATLPSTAPLLSAASLPPSTPLPHTSALSNRAPLLPAATLSEPTPLLSTAAPTESGPLPGSAAEQRHVAWQPATETLSSGYLMQHSFSTPGLTGGHVEQGGGVQVANSRAGCRSLHEELAASFRDLLPNAAATEKEPTSTSDESPPSSPQQLFQPPPCVGAPAPSGTIAAAAVGNSGANASGSMPAGHQPPVPMPLLVDMGRHWVGEASSAQQDGVDKDGSIHVVLVIPQHLRGRLQLWPHELQSHTCTKAGYLQAPGAARSLQYIGCTIPAGLRPFVTMAFASLDPVTTKALQGGSTDANMLLEAFCAVVRASLALHNGYECQERNGIFMVAFAGLQPAVEWGLLLQVCLMKVDWAHHHHSMAGLPNTEEVRSPTGAAIFNGLRARVGVMHGEVIKICPHTTAGRADYFGPVLNRAARLQGAAHGGQVLAGGFAVLKTIQAWKQQEAEANSNLPAFLAAVNRGQRRVQGAAGPSSLKARSRRASASGALCSSGSLPRASLDVNRHYVPLRDIEENKAFAKRRSSDPLALEALDRRSIKSPRSSNSAMIAALPMTMHVPVSIVDQGYYAFKGVDHTIPVVSILPCFLAERHQHFPTKPASSKVKLVKVGVDAPQVVRVELPHISRLDLGMWTDKLALTPCSFSYFPALGRADSPTTACDPLAMPLP